MALTARAVTFASCEQDPLKTILMVCIALKAPLLQTSVLESSSSSQKASSLLLGPSKGTGDRAFPFESEIGGGFLVALSMGLPKNMVGSFSEFEGTAAYPLLA
jgi:hypothetical protein